MTNRLAGESSPYLKQHAANPVDWYPWGPEALERARNEDRPVLLSVGYSACHWCHVMERESFEDPSTAALMNEHFVNVKVDREERPDLDQVYMKAVQAMTGGGGWPMTVFLTPDLVPFHGGTYFPPEPRHGLPSFAQVLEAIADAFANRRDHVEAGGARLVEALARAADATGRGAEGRAAGDAVKLPARDVIDAVCRTLESRYDPRHGGFGNAPKFPQPVTLELLLRQHVATGHERPLEMALTTLRAMAAGGLRDHLAGGFHRYSVDALWLVPHFEKMLYDNALLARAYLDAWRITGDEQLRLVCEETLDYLLADLYGPAGGFYAARDADSEGAEGTFYLWSPAEIDDVLGPEEGALLRRVYGVEPGGNFEGRSILYLPHPITAVAAADGIDPAALRHRLGQARGRLAEVRTGREPPMRDEKVLVSWNGMAVRALAEAGGALGRADYVRAAQRSGDFLWSELRPGNRLLHTWFEGEAKVHGFLDDHAALGNAYLSLHGVTLEPVWLERAGWLCEEILSRFRDAPSGTFYDTASDAERLFVRPRDPTDSATPSGSSLAAELFARAAHVFDEDRYREAAASILAGDVDMVRRFGTAFGRMLCVLDRLHAQPLEVVVAGRRDDRATRDLVSVAHGSSAAALTLAGTLEGLPEPAYPLFAGRGLVHGEPAAYVCRRYSCRQPTGDVGRLRAELADGAR